MLGLPTVQLQCMQSKDLNFSKTILFVFKLPNFRNSTFLRETVQCIWLLIA